MRSTGRQLLKQSCCFFCVFLTSEIPSMEEEKKEEKEKKKEASEKFARSARPPRRIERPHYTTAPYAVRPCPRTPLILFYITGPVFFLLSAARKMCSSQPVRFSLAVACRKKFAQPSLLVGARVSHGSDHPLFGQHGSE